jgi:hypothetical protein
MRKTFSPQRHREHRAEGDCATSFLLFLSSPFYHLSSFYCFHLPSSRFHLSIVFSPCRGQSDLILRENGRVLGRLPPCAASCRSDDHPFILLYFRHRCSAPQRTAARLPDLTPELIWTIPHRRWQRPVHGMRLQPNARHPGFAGCC